MRMPKTCFRKHLHTQEFYHEFSHAWYVHTPAYNTSHATLSRRMPYIRLAAPLRDKSSFSSWARGCALERLEQLLQLAEGLHCCNCSTWPRAAPLQLLQVGPELHCTAAAGPGLHCTAAAGPGLDCTAAASSFPAGAGPYSQKPRCLKDCCASRTMHSTYTLLALLAGRDATHAVRTSRPFA
eukprot:115398-Chlamydomonas_euryale.AAC.1